MFVSLALGSIRTSKRLRSPNKFEVIPSISVLSATGFELVALCSYKVNTRDSVHPKANAVGITYDPTHYHLVICHAASHSGRSC